MSTLIQNANRIKGGAGKIKSLLLAEGQNADHIEGYADLLAECLVDAPSEQSWQGERVTAQGAEIDKGIALLNGLKGKAIKVVQIMQDNKVGINCTATNGTISTTSSGWAYCTDLLSPPLVYGRKYLMHYKPISMAEGADVYFYGNATAYTTETTAIITMSIESDVSELYARGVQVGNTFSLQLLDLTSMGLDSCTSADEVAKALGYASASAMPYIPYTEGSLIISHPSKIVSKGRNLWDEEWEVGLYDVTTGNKQSYPSAIRCKNYIPINPNTTYFFGCNTRTGNGVFFYDADKNFISRINYVYPYTSFESPTNAHYMCFDVNDPYGTTYNHDIAIIKGSSGEYTPYLEDEVAISLPSLFSDGIKSVGNIADEWTSKVVKRCGMVKLKELSWSYISSIGRFDASIAGAKGTASNTSPANILCSRYPAYPGTEWEGSSFCIVKESPESDTRVFVKDSRYTSLDAFVAALTDNDVLIYELATAIEQETPFPKPYYKVEHHGTETALATSRNILPSLIDAFIGYEDYSIVANLASAWGIEVGKIGKRVFDGTEIWTLMNTISTDDGSALKGFYYLNDIFVTSKKRTCYPYKPCNDNDYERVDKGITFVAYDGSGAYFFDNAFTSVDAWKSHLAHLYNIGCPLTIYYEKA